MYNSANCVSKTLVMFIMIVVPRTPLAAQNTIGTGVMPSPVSTITRVPVLVGEDAEMPCDIRPPMLNDSLLFVVWYRDDNPVYSYDTRMPASSAHWAEDSFLGRATWHSTPTSGLKLLNIQAKDRAVYTCRVDFQESPTRNYKVTLDVIELPRKPIIFDEYGEEISGTAGPYPEGGSFKLICTVKGGYPTPRIQWLKGFMLIKSLRSSDHQGQETRSLILEVLNLTRNDLDSEYTCSADNTILAMQLKTTVRIDLYLKPLTVDIVPLDPTLSTKRKSEFVCKTTGAKPPAEISWWLGGKKINSTTIVSGSGDSGTESLLPWEPLKEHSGKVLMCKAEHTKFNFPSIQSNITLNVYYEPEASIVADKVKLNNIEEGDDVHFDCKVDANPPAYKVTWEQNGFQLHTEPSIGSSDTAYTNLTLRNVSRHHAGQYTCTATNVEGDGKSAPLNIHVAYKPLCKRREVKIIAAALQEDISVECEVDAFPPPNSFEWTLNNSVWTLNNSASSIKVDVDRYIIEEKEGRSVLTYTPVSDVDYGTLTCRATNSAGQQLSPCVYTLMPQSNPYPPTNCTVYNLTYDSLDLLCEPGYEGGLQCIYVVEVWASDGLVVNTSNEVPLWNLRRLGSNRQLRLITYAANARGRSEHVTLTASTPGKIITINNFEEAQNVRNWELSWAVGVFLGTIVTVAVILCLAFIATRIRDRSRDYEVNIPIVKNQTVIIPTRTLQAEEKASRLDFTPSNKAANISPDPPRYSDITAAAEVKNPGYAHSTLRINPPTSLAPHPHYSDLQNDNVRFVVNAMTRPHREIVTTREPLLSSHQESYV